MVVYIYSITNLINNKKYIGSTKSLKNREYSHFRLLKKNEHHSFHLQASYNKYGKNNFKFDIIIECDKKNRTEMETYYINFYNSHNREFGYNIIEPNNAKFKCSEQTKNNIRNSNYHTSNATKIDKYDLNGKFIKTYPSIITATLDAGMKRNSPIIKQILEGKRKSYKCFTYVKHGEKFNYVPSNKQRNMLKFYK